ncbi:hypothetical protein FA10DRAFT_293010 [Acaromyces ingoldii]|uniref:Uncharacterized protein n=1 Tax=Acaromyces ingoldii TaxID=215250 RepID=A0A316YWQ9_9BASI|nr:hypothetical protein FA10DRAFT_293010 [Acaromyces ingoldii]PWN92225.1 hypothetical protein FA10DRAFT_293010 [Acaromyces ingoldii]
MKLRLLITLFLALSLFHECEGFRYRRDTDDIPRSPNRNTSSMNGFGPQENVLVENQGRAKLQVMDDAVVDIGPMNNVLQSCIHKKIDDATLTAIRDMIEKNHGKEFQGLNPETTNFDTFKKTLFGRGPQLVPYMQLFLQSGLGRCLLSLQ